MGIESTHQSEKIECLARAGDVVTCPKCAMTLAVLKEDLFNGMILSESLFESKNGQRISTGKRCQSVCCDIAFAGDIPGLGHQIHTANGWTGRRVRFAVSQK